MNLGIQYSDFGSMTPRKINAFAEAYRRRENRELDTLNLMAYIQGRYIQEAVASVLGDHKYPKEPYQLTGSKELTEEQKNAEIDKFFASLEIMQSNFENNKKQGSMM